MFEGRFGRLFRTLHAAQHEREDLIALSKAMRAKFDDVSADDEDEEENTLAGKATITSGATYLGQFIDHDLTFDPVSSLQRENDPDGLVDFRTPRFDLDCVYGRGPDDQPYLYRSDGKHFLLGPPLTGAEAFDKNARGLPRNTPDGGEPARALIGDPRNDENVIVSQLQSTFLRFHNKILDTVAGGDFAEAQKLVRWHYQWVVLYDFLPTICDEQVYSSLIKRVQAGDSMPNYKPIKEGYIPIEFSVAAYRFGHSMVRPRYRLNPTIELPIFDEGPNSFTSLVGFGDFPHNWAIDWGKFFDMGDNRPATGPERLMPAYKIDTSLVFPLGNLPARIATDPSSLPRRNLLRGSAMGLPSGQAVAHKLKCPILTEDKLWLEDANDGQAEPTKKTLQEISPRFKGNAPLWFYILAEAQDNIEAGRPNRLGKVGSHIVAETFMGIMLEDSFSFIRQNPMWTPAQVSQGKEFRMADLIKFAIS
jgi:hypothetical protein